MLLRRVFRRLAARGAALRSTRSPKLILAFIILVALPVFALWRGFGVDRASLEAGASEMEIERLDASTNRPNLVLKEKSGPRRLVVAMGQMEASSIVNDSNMPLQAPTVTAYALTRSIADGLGAKVARVVVNNATDRALFAQVWLETETRELAVDAMPSDAIALAVRVKAPIYVNASVLDKVGVVVGR